MDIYFFLRRRLDFICNLYEESTVSFREIKRKIEIGEEPFVDDLNPEDYDGSPPFLEEWQQADESIESLGRWCVILLANLLKTYLEEFASDMDRYYGHKFPEFTKYKEYLASLKKRKGWLLDYQSLFLSMYEIDWSRGPNLVAGLEHLVLTRNDFEHKPQLVSLYVMQDPKHRENIAMAYLRIPRRGFGMLRALL